jgi:hypothetical protein
MKPAVLLTQCLLLGLAFGCSKQEAASPPAATAAPAAATASQPPAATTGAPAASAPAPAPPPAKASRPVPIATGEGTLDRVRVEITELKRSTGGTLTLRFSIVNDSDKVVGHGDVGVGMGGLIDAPYTIGGVHLIDPVGKKKYFVAKDSAGACVCSTFGFVQPGTRANHWAKFSAPPDDVERISIVIPPFAPVDDVPISR